MSQQHKNDIKQIHIKLDPTLHHALKVEAVICGTSIQELVASLIRQRIEESKNPDNRVAASKAS